MKLWGTRRHSLPVANALAASRAVEPDVVLDVTQLHDEYADFVWRSLQRLGVPASSLEDALQDVFVVVHRRLDSYDATSKVSTWLFGICLRVASAHRKRAYLKHELGPLELWDPVDDGPMADPEHNALRHEAERRLRQGLEAMALERRAVFVMFEKSKACRPRPSPRYWAYRRAPCTRGCTRHAKSLPPRSLAKNRPPGLEACHDRTTTLA